MKLYKNVDIEDLEKILAEGILPISVTGNDNWSEGKRADNSKGKVFLFEAKRYGDSFVGYGLALIEVEVQEAELSEFTTYDVWKDFYTEYMVDRVKPEEIKAIYLPNIFDYGNSIEDKKIQLVDVEFNYYNYKSGEYESASRDIKDMFSETARLSTYEFNYLRGKSSDGRIVDSVKCWRYKI